MQKYINLDGSNMPGNDLGKSAESLFTSRVHDGGNRNDFEAEPLEFSTVFKLILCVNRGEDLALFNVQKMVGTNR